MRSKMGEESRLERANRKIPGLMSRSEISGVMLYPHLQRLVHRDWPLCWVLCCRTYRGCQKRHTVLCNKKFRLLMSGLSLNRLLINREYLQLFSCLSSGRGICCA